MNLDNFSHGISYDKYCGSDVTTCSDCGGLEYGDLDRAPQAENCAYDEHPCWCAWFPEAIEEWEYYQAAGAFARSL